MENMFTSYARDVSPRKFKPCPFCGEDELVIDNEGFFNWIQSTSSNGNAYLTLTCANCDLKMAEGTCAVKNYKGRVELLRKKWNKRGGKCNE